MDYKLWSQEHKTTMSTNVTTNATCCDSEETSFPSTEVDVALTVVSLMIFGICALIFIFSFIFGICRKEANLLALGEDAASQESEEDMIRRKESIAKELIVKEWVPPDDPPVESTEGDLDTPPSQKTVEAPQPPAPPINSSPTSCAVGSDDCESLAGEEEEEEMAGCAICLSQFKPQQLVCESNNASCQHIFHKDCIVDWLMKRHNNCPMCREVYLLKTV
jgi:hypothetical protein